MHPRTIRFVQRTIQDSYIKRVGLSHQNLCTVLRYVPDAAKRRIMALVEHRGAIHGIQHHCNQRHVDSKSYPAPHSRRRTWQPREQCAQPFGLFFFVLNRLLHIQPLTSTIFGAHNELYVFAGPISALYRLLDNNVELIG